MQEISNAYQDMKDLQEQFKEAHKMSQTLMKDQKSPQQYKQLIMEKEEEREQLMSKINRVKGKVDAAGARMDTADFEQLQKMCNKLRRCQVEMGPSACTGL